MTKYAEAAAEAFVKGKRLWRERPVAPDPYLPTAKQIRDLWLDLLARLVASGDTVVASRHLRVRRLTSSKDTQQRFVFEAETQKSDAAVRYEAFATVDADGHIAKDV